MGEVDLNDQMKVTYEFDRRSKFCFYLRVFFDFLDIAVVNSNIVYNKIASTPSMTSLDFWDSIAHDTEVFRRKKGSTSIQTIKEVKRTIIWCCGPPTRFCLLWSSFIVPCVHQRKWRIEHMCAVLLAILHFVLKKTIIAFNNTIPSIDFLPLTNKYFMHWWRHHFQYDYLWPFILQFILYTFRVVNDNIKYTSWKHIWIMS